MNINFRLIFKILKKMIKKASIKNFKYNILFDGNNYAYKIYKNVPTEVIYYYHTDHLMTPLSMAGGNQEEFLQAEYYPFGRIYSQTGEISNNLRFPGQYAEEVLNNSSLYYNWHRWYGAKQGRYYQSDVANFGFNIRNDFYFYSWNNPPVFYDFNGLIGIRKCNSIFSSKDNGEKYAITVCNGCGGFEWRWTKKPICAEECFKKHEEAHIEWFQKYRPDACKGKPKGSNPKLEPGDKDSTECYAYKVSLECMEKWKLKSRMSGQVSSCPTFVDRNINIQRKYKNYHCTRSNQ